ncbi:sulfatase-like hydrolase/transferase [Telluribacter sp.]|jgi:arylsulfatase A|uniref:sulfatase-like hydrolase/transferase n=1 Tax=Telluribacter sp. TaxID=1978767 RepID=UPI002E11011F|nr:sulfatase-like hydrolase/transferase [Telluribacter sp.]
MLFFIVSLIVALSSLGFLREKAPEKPNVILIMADDMGYECLGTYGSTTYRTPVLDSLASNGIRFDRCISQPLCSPSRLKLMTGKYNYRNYEYFGYLNPNQYTIGNLMHDAGYKTCIAGKWQLNGLSNKDSISTWNDPKIPNRFGFEEYCLWQLTKGGAEGERYSAPLFEKNGELIQGSKDQYGPDIFSDFVIDFIERKKDQRFFIYYPMVLVHYPFVPTPDSPDWKNKEGRYKKDTAYFKDMVAYTDKIVGKITDKLHELNLDKNTLIIFTGDNGTHSSIRTPTIERTIQGGKGNTTDAGTHVPLIAYWPDQIRHGRSFEGLIEFSDFFPTLADIAGQTVQSDGRSFYPLLANQRYEPRATAFVHYDPRWSANVNRYRNRFVRNLEYKLYQDGKFYSLKNDILEENPLKTDKLSPKARKAHRDLQKELALHPKWQ